MASADHGIAIYGAPLAVDADAGAGALSGPHKLLTGHTDYINAVAFCPAVGSTSLLATGSGARQASSWHHGIRGGGEPGAGRPLLAFYLINSRVGLGSGVWEWVRHGR